MVDSILDQSNYYKLHQKGQTKAGPFICTGELSKFLKYYHNFLKKYAFKTKTHNFCLRCFAFIPTSIITKKNHNKSFMGKGVITCAKFFGYNRGTGSYIDKFIRRFKSENWVIYGLELEKLGYIKWLLPEGFSEEELIERRKVEPYFVPKGAVLSIRRPWFNFKGECLHGKGGSESIIGGSFRGESSKFFI